MIGAGRPTRSLRPLAALLPFLLLAACGGAETPPPADAPDGEAETTASPIVADEPQAEPAPETVAAMRSQLTIVAYGPDDVEAPIDLAVTDPLSRTTGVAAAGGRAYESIPDSRYEIVGVQRDSSMRSGETAPLVSVDEPAGGTWTAQVVARSDTRYRIDVRAAFDDGTGRRASAPWETLGAGETRRWRITYDPGDAESFALEAMP